MTDEERILWSELRRRQLMGLRFRRQVPLGPYIVDFVCLEHRFVVELDGLQHGEADNLARDAARTSWLEAQGFRVFRAWNGEIRDNLKGVLESMLGEIGMLDAPMMPLPECSPPSGATRHLPREGGGEEIPAAQQTGSRR